MNDGNHLTTKQVAADLGRHVTWLMLARKTPGKGPPCYKIGDRYIYKEDEYKAWLAKQRVE